MNGVMFVNLNLEDNLQDTEKFWSKLRLDMAELRKTDLPDGVEGPVVDYDFGDTVAALMAIHGNGYGYRELKDYAERIEATIRRIRAVSKVKRIGEQTEQIEVTSSLDRLSQYSVQPDQIMKALEGRNIVHYAGAVPTERGKPPIQATGAFETEDQIRHVMDVSRTGQPVYIGDLANVERVYKDPTQYARSRGERAILLSVEMQEGNKFVVDVWLPEGWKVQATEAAVKRIEAVLDQEKEVVNHTSFIGSSFPRFYYNVNPQLPDKNYAQLLVSTESAEVTPNLVKELRPRLAQAVPEARVFLSELQQGPVQEAAIEVRLTGDDEHVLRHWGQQVQQLLENTPGSLDVHSDWREDAYRMKVNLREEVANRLGFTNATIGRELAGGFEGAPVTTYWEG